ncbi:MAG: C40 family peptidase [Gemmatimonadales bacterium]
MNPIRLLGLGLGLVPSGLAAQEVSASRWLSERQVMDYRLAVGGLGFGPLRVSPFGQLNFQGPRSDRAVLVGGGADARLRLPIAGVNGYLVGGASAGFLDLENRFGLGPWFAWSAGGGVELGRAGPIGASFEVRFQRLSRGATEGVSIGLRLGPPLGAKRSRELDGTSPLTPAFPSPETSPRSLPTAGPGSAPTSRHADLVQAAADAMGAPYRWGGSDENGFDCSGLIQYAYQSVGIDLPRTSADQARHGRSVRRAIDQLVPGDILAFAGAPGGPVTHVGLYLGNGKFIHSASGGVRRSTLSAEDPAGRWWFQRWVDARRILD